MAEVHSSQRNLGGIAARFELAWDGGRYERACRKATVEGIRVAVRVVRKRALELVPRAGKHRFWRRYPVWTLNAEGERRYPKGWSGEMRDQTYDAKRISQGIIGKVVDKPGKPVMGFVKDTVGYAVFVNYGHKIVARGGKLVGEQAGVFFLQRALIEEQEKVIGALEGKWPK